MRVEDFNYNLPEELIAQTPLKDRSSSKLLVVDKKTGEFKHYHFYDILDMLDEKDNHKSIILMRSINAYGGFGLPIYSSAKAGLVAFSKSVHPHLTKLGIRVNTICPGTIVTEATLAEPKNFEELLKTTKLGRFMTKEEVADLTYKLCELSNETGKVVNIDAGQNEVVNGTSN